MPSPDEERAAQIAKDLAYCVSSQARYQLALEIIRAVRAAEREELAEKVRAVLDHFHTSHQMHWDREGTHGANCPACKIDSETRNMLRAMVMP